MMLGSCDKFRLTLTPVLSLTLLTLLTHQTLGRCQCRKFLYTVNTEDILSHCNNSGPASLTAVVSNSDHAILAVNV